MLLLLAVLLFDAVIALAIKTKHNSEKRKATLVVLVEAMAVDGTVDNLTTLVFTYNTGVLLPMFTKSYYCFLLHKCHCVGYFSASLAATFTI